MARVAVIAAALSRVVWRDTRSIGTVAGNNFFLCLLLVCYQQVESGVFLMTLLGFPVLLLLSADALGKVPAERLASWPLTSWEHSLLRVVSLALNPLMWIAGLVWFRSGRGAWAFPFVGLLVVCQVLTAAVKKRAARSSRASLSALIPSGTGWLSVLLAKNLRQLLSTLDPYPLVPLALGTLIYRIASTAPNASAFTVISIAIGIGLSTFAQSLFGLDGGSGANRYRILPLSGWKILLAKGLAVLGVLLILVLPLRPDVGMAAGLVALAIGHHSSVLGRMKQQRWRFTSGQIWPIGLVQVMSMVAIGMAVAQSELWLLFAVLAYTASLFLYGRVWDRAVIGRVAREKFATASLLAEG